MEHTEKLGLAASSSERLFNFGGLRRYHARNTAAGTLARGLLSACGHAALGLLARCNLYSAPCIIGVECLPATAGPGSLGQGCATVPSGGYQA